MIVKISVEAEFVLPDSVYDIDTIEEETAIILGIRAHMMDAGGSNFSYTVSENIEQKI